MTLYIVKPDGSFEPAIRKLTDEERDIYAGAVVKAITMAPSFRDGITLIRPFMDLSADTAYTDKYSRVGLSKWFFNELDVFQRASVILHETFHVLNNTFSRAEALGADPNLSNISSDLEINSNLHRLQQVDLSYGIMANKKPFNFELYKSMEQYYHLIKEDDELLKQLEQNNSQGQGDPDCPQHGQGSSQSENSDENSEDSSGGGGSNGDESSESDDSGSESASGGSDSSDSSNHGDSGAPCTCPSSGNSASSPGQGQSEGNTKGCDQASEQRADAADEIGVERASSAEQNIAKKNVAARIEEELKGNRAAGQGHNTEFLQLALNHMRPPKVDWRQVFRRIVSRLEDSIVRGRSDYSYRRTSRRIQDSRFIFPGMVKYQPVIMMGIDTSGSMSHDDHLRSAQEAEGILKAVSRSKNSLKIFSVDTEVSNVKVVDNVRALDLRGGGGTEMSVAWRYVLSLPKKEYPDIFVLSSDCYVPWGPVEEALKDSNKFFKSIILSTTAEGYKTIPESVHQLATVLDISEKD